MNETELAVTESARFSRTRSLMVRFAGGRGTRYLHVILRFLSFQHLWLCEHCEHLSIFGYGSFCFEMAWEMGHEPRETSLPLWVTVAAHPGVAGPWGAVSRGSGAWPTAYSLPSALTML